MATRLGPFDRDEVLRVWGEERERQFREEVPQFREVDLAQRVVRVLARLRGMPAPPADARWDDEAAAGHSTPEEAAWVVDAYSRAFVDALPPSPVAAGAARTPRAALPPRDPVQLAARGHHRPLRRGARLDALPGRDRRLAAGRDDQAAPGDLRGGARGARRPGAARPRPSSTSATTGRRTWSGPSGPAGGRRGSGRGPRIRRSPGRSADGEAEPDLVLDRLEDLEAALDGAS